MEMGAVHPIVLPPRCPGGEDPEVQEFLRLVRVVTGATWAELELQPNGSAPSQKYRLGSGNGIVARAELAVGRDFDAILRLGGLAEPEGEQVELLTDSLARMLDRRRLLIQAEILRGALESIPSSVFLFDDEGEILFASPSADRLLSLQTEDELLATCSDRPTQPLFTLLSSLADGVASGDRTAPNWKGTVELGDGRVMHCLTTRLLDPAADLPGAVLVLLQPLESEVDARVQTFSLSHGLSPREQEVLGLLEKGLTTGAIAESLGISPHTVRDHLKHLYRKTGTKGRSELLGLITRATRVTAEA
jgi:DNA-binding CsgD family transcriptional regulator/PAS domain-containing protein